MQTSLFSRILLTLGSSALLFSGCASSSSASPETSASSVSSSAGTASSADTQTVTLGVTGAIYEDLWQPAKEKLKDENIDLEFVQFADFATPNSALSSGDIDLNAFQHEIYLNTEKESQGYRIEPIGYTFIIPLNLYSEKWTSLEELPDGAVIAIPDDLTNGGRALKVLEEAGLIGLKEDAGFSPTVTDIVSNPKNLTVRELKANTLPSALPDVDAALITGNFALDYGLKTEDALYQDSALDAKEYWNLIAARSEDLKDPAKKSLYEEVVRAFQTPETEKVFNDQYGGYFIAEGWDNE